MSIKLEKYYWPELDEACSNYQYHSPIVVDDELWAWHMDDTDPGKVEVPYLINIFNDGISRIRQQNRRYHLGLIALFATSTVALAGYGWHTHSLTGMAFLYQPLPAHLYPMVTVMRIVAGVAFALFLVLITIYWLLIRNNVSVSGKDFREKIIALLAFLNLAVAIDIAGFIVTTSAS